jgi:bla regulator protein BlaR1
MDDLPLMLAGVHLIGWALVHFIWQGALLGLLYAVVRTALPRGEARYRFGMGMLIALALCPLLTIWHLLQAVPMALQGSIEVASSIGLAQGVAVSTTSWDLGIDAMLPWFVLAWSVGVMLLSLRAWRQWRGLQALIRTAVAMPAWQLRVTAMAQRFELRRRVTVLCSKVITTPALVGWVRPVILLPVAVACNFPVTQIELILAHELAHLRRWDPLANLFQVALETLHFYHPVVHWISRDVRNEREICCDRLALSINGGSRHTFAAALAELGELRERHGSLLLAASGGVLLDRVQQLVVPARVPVGTSARFAAVLLAAALVSLTLRMEWKQAQAQRWLSESAMQLQAALAPAWLPLARPAVSWHLTDLALTHVTALRPVAESTTVAAPTSPTSASAHADVDDALRPAVLQVADLALPRDETPAPVRQVEPVVAAASTPTPTHMQQPIYPQNALMRGIEGRVVVEFALASDGNVRDLQVVSAKPVGTFEQAAIRAMRGWKYSLPTNTPTPSRYRQTFAFTLNAANTRNDRSNVYAGEEIQARAGCQIPTGTHICRRPYDMASPASVEPRFASSQ